MSEIKKTCSLCRCEKDASEFYKKKNVPDGLDSYCKKCRRIKNFRWYKKNKQAYNEQRHKKYIDNKDACRAQNKAYYMANTDKISKRRKEIREAKKTRDIPAI